MLKVTYTDRGAILSEPKTGHVAYRLQRKPKTGRWNARKVINAYASRLCELDYASPEHAAEKLS